MGLAGGLATNGQVGGGGTATPAIAFGTAAARPAAAAGNANTAYYATDTGEITFSNGAIWSAIKSFSQLVTANNGVQVSGFSAQIIQRDGGTGGMQVGSGVTVEVGGNLDITTAGSGVAVKEGANAKQGTATLVAGSVVVANTSVTANSRILLTSNADGGTPGWLRVSARTAGTSFTITSSSGTDTSTVAFQIFEPG